MPGQQLEPTWIGNRAELLAVYALSSLAAVTHVRREEDYGLDLLCTLLRHQANVLRAGRSFGVQVKSSGVQELHYGGLDKHGNWKDYEVKWLFSQDQPILIAVSDIKHWRVRLYSTLRIWYLLYQIGSRPYPGEIVLVPDEELPSGQLQTLSQQWRYRDEKLPKCADDSLAGNGFSYRVPLGQPIVDLPLGEDDAQPLVGIQDAVDQWLALDYVNIGQRNLGVPYYLEWHSWTPNQSPGPASVAWCFWNFNPGANIVPLLNSISPAIQALLLHLKYQRNFVQAQAVVPLARWMRDNHLLNQLGLDALEEFENYLAGSLK